MKRVLVLIVSLVLVVMLESCGKEGDKTSESKSSNLSSGSETAGFLKEPETDNDFNQVDIDWNNKSLKFKDSGGYEFKVDYKISPWILLSNTDAIKSAWSVVGQDNELPGFNDWGLIYSSNQYSGGFFSKEMNDMYYSVGTVKISNVTSGWSINENNPRKVKFGLGLKRTEYGYYDNYNNQKTISTMGKIFGLEDSNSIEKYVSIDFDLKSDESQLFTFILMTPENFTPKNPGGDYFKLLKDKLVTLYGTGENSFDLDYDRYNSTAKTKNVNLGVIGKGKK